MHNFDPPIKLHGDSSLTAKAIFIKVFAIDWAMELELNFGMIDGQLMRVFLSHSLTCST